MDVHQKQTHKTYMRNEFKKEPFDVNTLILYCSYFVLWDKVDPIKAARDTLIKSCGLLKQDVNHNVVQNAKRLILRLDVRAMCMNCTSEHVSTPAESASSGDPEGQSVQTYESNHSDNLGRSPVVPRPTPESDSEPEDLEVMPQVASSGTIAAELWLREYRRKMQQYLKSQAGLKDRLATSRIFDCGHASRSSLCEAGVLTRDEIRAFAKDFSKPFPEIPRAMREYLDFLSKGDALASWKEALDVVSPSGLSVPEKQLTRVCSEDPDVVRKAQSTIKKLRRKAQPGLDSMKAILVGSLKSDLEYACHVVENFLFFMKRKINYLEGQNSEGWLSTHVWAPLIDCLMLATDKIIVKRGETCLQSGSERKQKEGPSTDRKPAGHKVDGAAEITGGYHYEILLWEAKPHASAVNPKAASSDRTKLIHCLKDTLDRIIKRSGFHSFDVVQLRRGRCAMVFE
ncbi:hypothetical protein HDU87_005531 [Geranomyces variabilis]|uniref:Uncharacterized protein n=1 Tax=Geranomyces variabilis TaxID=109894 RepID=A0AAD5XP07_9FUNG|nr:hypothetical protein HDU87_005531 [Geranomyces variabilis]